MYRLFFFARIIFSIIVIAVCVGVIRHYLPVVTSKAKELYHMIINLDFSNALRGLIK